MAFWSRPRRDLKKEYIIVGSEKPRSTITGDGDIIHPERRRLTPKAAGIAGDRGMVRGAAEELFINLGRGARGLGTKSKAERKKKQRRKQRATGRRLSSTVSKHWQELSSRMRRVKGRRKGK